MKPLILAVLLAVIPAYSATWDQLPTVVLWSENDLNAVQADFDNLHPWKVGSPLPASFKEAGLAAPVVLVDCDLYLDGGSHIYLFRGANGKYLLLCTDSGMYGTAGSNKVTNVDKPHLYLAAAHFTEKKKAVVPYDSPCERFLVAAITNEVERLNKLSEKERWDLSHQKHEH